MLTTANPEYDRRFRLWRQHGMTVNDRQRHEASRVVFEDYDELGYNYRMTDLQAAVGRAQLSRLPQIVAQRRAVAARYRELLAKSGLHLPVEPSWARSNWQSYCVGLPDGCDQRIVMQRLLDAGIATRRGIMCAHREPAYAKEPWRSGSSLAQSELAQDRSLVLPLFPELREQEQIDIVTRLHLAIAEGATLERAA